MTVTLGATHGAGSGLASIVLLALLSAASYGLGAVLQHQAAAREHPDLGAGLVLRLVKRPLWLVGNALDGFGYLFQFLALRRGSLSLVEPLLVASLVFAVPVAAWLDHRRISVVDLTSTAAIAAGLGLFLAVARPGVGHPHASGAAWVALTAIIVGCCGALTLAARGPSRRRAAVLLAAGSGTAFGYVAAVTERTGHLLDGGVLHTLTSWAPYALVVGGVAALMLTQSAFHAGVLRWSLPTLTVSQPLVAVAIGLGFFGEQIRSGGLASTLEVLGLVVVTIGVYVLARSPALSPEKSEGDPEPPG